jgi:hypothetical protein
MVSAQMLSRKSQEGKSSKDIYKNMVNLCVPLSHGLSHGLWYVKIGNSVWHVEIGTTHQCGYKRLKAEFAEPFWRELRV